VCAAFPEFADGAISTGRTAPLLRARCELLTSIFLSIALAEEERRGREKNFAIGSIASNFFPN
jgi:hypothetical protein